MGDGEAVEFLMLQDARRAAGRAGPGLWGRPAAAIAAQRLHGSDHRTRSAQGEDADDRTGTISVSAPSGLAIAGAISRRARPAAHGLHEFEAGRGRGSHTYGPARSVSEGPGGVSLALAPRPQGLQLTERQSVDRLINVSTDWPIRAHEQ